MTGSY